MHLQLGFFKIFASIPHNLLRKSYSQTSKSLSFPNAPIGNPSETRTGPSIKTFGGECAREGATLAR